MTRLYAHLRGWLAKPRADRVIFVVALALCALCLDTGLSADDYVHQLIAEGSSEIEGFRRESRWDLFRFAGGEHTRNLMREGVISWWDDPEAKLAFFRPVTAATHLLDHALWPHTPWLMHLHSMAWGALMLFGIAVVLRRLCAPGWVYALAFAVYAFEDGRAWMGAWTAARNGTVATAISIWALWGHDRWRRDGWTPGRVVGPVALGLGLLASEGSIAIAGYLFAYALCLDRGVGRWRALAPYAVVVVAWSIAYRVLDYGVANSGLYFHPASDPVGFAKAAAERVPILFQSEVIGPWSDWYTALFPFPRVLLGLWVSGAVTLLLFAYIVTPLVRTEPVVRFAVIGAGLALLPASATFLSDRLTPWLAIGAAIAVARLIASRIDTPERFGGGRAWLLGPMVGWLVIANLVADPLLLGPRARGNATVAAMLGSAERSIPADESVRDKWLVLLNPAVVPQAAYIAITRAATGTPRPARTLWLAESATALTVERVDGHTLRLHPRGGYLLNPGARLFRGERPVDDVVDLGGVTLRTIERTADRRPLVVEARFDRTLDDPSFLWMQWDRTRFVPFSLPNLGERVELPPADIFEALFTKRDPLPFRAILDPPVGP